MRSFELFILLKVKKKNLHFTYIFILKYIMCDKLHHFMKKNSNILHQIIVY